LRRDGTKRGKLMLLERGCISANKLVAEFVRRIILIDEMEEKELLLK